MPKVVKTFTLKWDEDLGPEWMNTCNLLLCLNSKQHCKFGLIERVEEIQSVVQDVVIKSEEFIDGGYILK